MKAYRTGYLSALKYLSSETLALHLKYIWEGVQKVSLSKGIGSPRQNLTCAIGHFLPKNKKDEIVNELTQAYNRICQ